MGYLTVDGRGRVRPATTMGETFLNKILGTTGDHISRYEQKGDSLAKIFFTWKNTLDQYTAEAQRIPTGSGEARLRGEYTALYQKAAKLDPAFAPGATQGTETRAQVNEFVGGIKAFGADKQALMKQYGLAALPKGSVPSGNIPGRNPNGAAAGALGGIPWWALALGALAIAKAAKK